MNFERLREQALLHKTWRAANPGPLISIWNLRTCGREALPVPSPMSPHSMVYVGRACANFSASPLGNPYTVENYGREKSVALYRDWLESKINTDAEVNAALEEILRYSLELRGIALGCWCYPAPCHAAHILSIIERMYKERHNG